MVHTHRKLNAFMFEHVSERNTEFPCFFNLTNNYDGNSFFGVKTTGHTLYAKFEKDIEDGQI